jgi:hypothetical protein
MWQIFREYLLYSSWARVMAVLNSITLIWGVALIFDPSIANKVPPLARADPRIWYGLAIGFTIFTSLWILHKAAEYRRKMEGTDNIRFVYNVERYKPSRQITDRGTKEIHRVGIRVLGNGAVESLIVLPDTLERVDDKSYKRIQVSQTKLHAMIDNSDPIYGGHAPSYWVDVFSHVIGSSGINICYDKHTEGNIHLPNGRYELTLIARAKPKTRRMGIMTITMVDGAVSVEMRKRDVYGG